MVASSSPVAVTVILYIVIQPLFCLKEIWKRALRLLLTKKNLQGQNIYASQISKRKARETFWMLQLRTVFPCDLIDALGNEFNTPQ